MKDTRRDCEVLTAKILAGFVRDQHPDWLHSYLEEKKRCRYCSRVFASTAPPLRISTWLRSANAKWAQGNCAAKL
ncbi:hypothetical protein JG688_00018126 [Phytophthora aleatoria]|uniref:Uncharacterized protein n=1 Tax=Phytophthora aleatoria TaxID=2496075 RepID=A0A8J5M0U9_9STRA|nr:hypothetical protein JG688_00018126 [Phytophthora aleatoria]